MDIPVNRLLRLLQPDRTAEVRAAAVLILGELGVRDADAAAGVAARLDDPDPAVRENAIRAAGQLKATEALPTLLERIAGGGEEARLAAEAVAQLGVKGVKSLQELMPRVAPGLRRYIAAALTTSTAAGADAAGVAVLLDKDPQVASSAATAIVAKVPTLTPAQRAALADELVAVASDRKHPLPPAAGFPVVRVLAALNVPAADEVLWDRVLPPHPPEVRAAALQAVGGRVEKATRDQWRKLFACAAEPDFRIAAPALMVLNRFPVADKQVSDWAGLFAAPDVAARRLAVEKLGDRDTSEVAEGLMSQLRHADRGLRDAARARLVKLTAGRKGLTDALLAAETPEAAWEFARLVAGFAADLTAAMRGKMFALACRFVEADDRRADALLFVLREADAAGLRDGLVEKAVALRKKKKYDVAMLYLRAVARDPSIGFDVRLELALCGLKVSAHALDVADRSSDPCLRHLGVLVEQDADQLTKEVGKAKWLDAEDLFYAGFHFAEQFGRPRELGADLLRLVLKRQPKGELAKSARNKLKLTGLA
jgi:HEAT repeat protein